MSSRDITACTGHKLYNGDFCSRRESCYRYYVYVTAPQYACHQSMAAHLCDNEFFDFFIPTKDKV